MRAGALPTVGAYGPVRLHLPSERIFAYFPSLESMKKSLRAGAMPTIGAYVPVRLHLPPARSFGYFSIMGKGTEKKVDLIFLLLFDKSGK